ncbi:hypothetical protein COU54_00105 [Candidatus Pacearchaeota archaeon CG10_big_fil_rev_8_21_14_0_10_31_24]|nr:MAG: hypothetical protein COU54_00105 [Candidatus Pacearchaeota archaeon CG10_big_fil_rev_8_21_14_0_10_31_24]
MPQAVTHFLFAALLVALFRDYYLKKRNKKHFPLHYVFIGGIGGVLPDIDFAVFWFFQLMGKTVWEVHRGLTHTLLFATIFIVLGLMLRGLKKKDYVNHHRMKLSIICTLLAFGILAHIFLDYILFGNTTNLLYPFMQHPSIGLNLTQYIPTEVIGIFFATLDGIFLMIWLIYLETKHKISDFI